MKENYKGGAKNSWQRLFKKKWFFPTLYLSIAALLLATVIWFQALEDRTPDSAIEDDFTNNVGDMFDEEVEAVLQQNEMVKMPIDEQDDAEIVTTFYDYDGEKEAQESGLILYNNRYYQSTGVDIARADGESFDVVAALSGTVEDVKEDPLLGNVVIMSHDNDIKTYYASLEKIDAKAGDQIKQGDTVGRAGKSLFNQESGTHVHFEIRKNDVEVNPETFFNKPVTLLQQFDVETVDASDDEEDDERDSEDEEEQDEDSREDDDDKEKEE